ncbi:MAG TPA: bifunctional phosphoribosylaminoimidazolecarboxamide formyltransferase/IMP cyclohydrolase, partial [Isosphaeraceae bacterium]|nr:bifunctional phosphoribosylaminoimidazolecarboxamide formyltransferase/IMP cyclohydrolase [Isosphaeraceae bacterium]
MADLVAVRRALLSVSDKRDLIELGRFLAEQGVELIASGGTRTALEAVGLPVIEVSAYTGQKEILGGRVKTLHPKLHGGLLARRNLREDMQTLEKEGMEPIDLVVVNLYPFENTVARPECPLEDAVENIDIGGPSLIRGASKNHAFVTVLTAPEQYDAFIHEIRSQGGTTRAFRERLAREAFALTARYDAAISAYLSQNLGEPEPFPPSMALAFERRASLRYGENPHQRAAFYVEPNASGANLATAKVRHGKELSYNNLLDLDSAIRLVRLFREPAAVVLKHNNPCGAAESDDLASAFERAYEGDPVSAFGGIVGLNRPVDLATAEKMAT